MVLVKHLAIAWLLYQSLVGCTSTEVRHECKAQINRDTEKYGSQDETQALFVFVV
jgi:hypothetical protein